MPGHELPRRSPRYRSIRDYGVIGNETSVALVRMDGSIDWCCLPHLDSPSVFAALLDADKGGHFLVRPRAPVTGGSQEYVENTNVLVTTFEVDGGRLRVEDFMPVGGRLLDENDRPAEPEIYRCLTCTTGDIDVEVVWVPRLDYARVDTSIDRRENGFVAHGAGSVVALAGLPEGRMAAARDGPAVVGRLRMRQGDRRHLRMRWGERRPGVDPQAVERELERTSRAWRSWVARWEEEGGRTWAGPWEKEVIRSELFLKLMTVPDSGALAAAPTTSLPETLGGVRNWDYRYAWKRDAAQIAQAFMAVGHPGQADAFIEWAEGIVSAREPVGGAIEVLYPLHPGTPVRETTLDHLEGYRGSRPVRIGNDAVDQLQLCVYGELLNAVYERVRLAEGVGPGAGDFLRTVADEAAAKWELPDFGIWEVQNGPSHQVYSKVMTWVALDRAIWLDECGYLEGEPDRWRIEMNRIAAQVLEHGYDDEIGAFTHRYGAPALDAASLLIPVMEFLPPGDPRVASTIDRIQERLTVNDLVYRYRMDDGLPGEEGAFALCTCWLVDALSLSDRLDEAGRIFENLLGRTNHLGLLSEQVDPYSGEFLGNFPQAYSHLGIINSTLYLGAKEGREPPVGPLLGMRDVR